MSVPIFENILFRIGMFTGVTLFIYYILDIDYKKIKYGIIDWLVYMQIFEMSEQKKERVKIYDKIKFKLKTYELQGDIYMKKFMDRFYPDYQKDKKVN
jgi:hypothetical protein